MNIKKNMGRSFREGYNARKVSTMIAALQNILENYGDLEVKTAPFHGGRQENDGFISTIVKSDYCLEECSKCGDNSDCAHDACQCFYLLTNH